MKSDNKIYRKLQLHLNQQPVGFPRGRSGEDIRLLKHLFTPDEARLALYLTHKHATLSEIQNRAPSAVDHERVGPQPDPRDTGSDQHEQGGEEEG